MGVMDFLKNVVSPSLTSIQKSLENILNNNIKEEKAEQKAANDARKAGEKAKSREKESKFESAAVKKLGDAAQKVLKPVQSIFDTLWNFVKNIGLGIAALKLVEILSDPGKFFRDLGNQIIDALNTVIKTVFDILFFPINEFIKALNTTLDEFEKAINGSLGLIPGVPKLNLPTIPIIQAPQIPNIPQPPAPAPTPVPGMEGGGRVDSSTGVKINSMGADTQLVALQPGEVVMSNKAVSAYGADTLLGMNAAAGGTNIPKMGEVPGYQNGGMVGSHIFGGDGVPASGSSSPKPAQSAPTIPAVPTSKPSGGLSPQQKAFAETVAFAEGTAGTAGYNTWFGGSEYGGDLSKKTINEVIALQHKFLAEGRGSFGNEGKSSAAVGKYQMIEPETYAAAAGLNPAVDKFTPANQDKLFLFGYVMKQANISEAEINAPQISDRTIDKLAPVFASFPNLFGPDKFGQHGTNSSFYGQGGKTAQQIKNRYLEERAKMMGAGYVTPSTSSTTPSSSSSQPSQAHTENYNFLDVSIPGQSSAPSIRPPMSGSGGGTSVVMAGGGGSQKSTSSFAGGNQSVAPMFSPIDENNPELLVVKSIYNIVG
jgi:muramidase (phage lysozyme)